MLTEHHKNSLEWNKTIIRAYVSFCKGGLNKTVTRKEHPISIDLNETLYVYPILIEVRTVPHSVSTKASLHDDNCN